MPTSRRSGGVEQIQDVLVDALQKGLIAVVGQRPWILSRQATTGRLNSGGDVDARRATSTICQRNAPSGALGSNRAPPRTSPRPSHRSQLVRVLRAHRTVLPSTRIVPPIGCGETAPLRLPPRSRQ